MFLLGNKQVSCHVWKFLPQNHPLFESFKLVFKLKSSAASSRHIGPPFRASAKIPVKVINTSIHQACPVFPFFFCLLVFFFHIFLSNSSLNEKASPTSLYDFKRFRGQKSSHSFRSICMYADYIVCIEFFDT